MRAKRIQNVDLHRAELARATVDMSNHIMQKLREVTMSRSDAPELLDAALGGCVAALLACAQYVMPDTDEGKALVRHQAMVFLLRLNEAATRATRRKPSTPSVH